MRDERPEAAARGSRDREEREAPPRGRRGDGRDLGGRGRVVFRGHEDALASGELRLKGRELVLDRRDRPFGLGVRVGVAERGCVHEVDEEAGPLDVPQEPDPEAVSFVRSLDKPGHVRRDERAEALPGHDPEVRDERREGIVRDLRASRGNGRDEGRLARVRQAHERHVREELELEREVPRVAFRAGIRAPRRPVRGGCEPRVSPPTLAARGHEQGLPLLDEVADDLSGVAVLHDRSDRH